MQSPIGSRPRGPCQTRIAWVPGFSQQKTSFPLQVGTLAGGVLFGDTGSETQGVLHVCVRPHACTWPGAQPGNVDSSS